MNDERAHGKKNEQFRPINFRPSIATEVVGGSLSTSTANYFMTMSHFREKSLVNYCGV